LIYLIVQLNIFICEKHLITTEIEADRVWYETFI